MSMLANLLKPVFTRRTFARLLLLLWGSLLALTPTSLQACNIPVFRYALERWRPDFVQLVVFTDDAHPDSERSLLRTLRIPSSANAASADEVAVNAEVEAISVQKLGPYESLWTKLTATNAEPSLPYVVLQKEWNQRTLHLWHGNVPEARTARLLDSPKRQALRARLLQGDAIVWLLLKSTDQDKNKAIRDTLQATFKQLSKTLQLPEGIGLPGSELYADVPLVLDFSVLEIDPQDPQETYLRELLKSFYPEEYEQGEPILAPVFGRGRVLEVLPASSVDAKLVGELTTFLCGACSCKVKGLNPGFDLLMTANWDVELFGENGERPSADGPANETPLPTLITIPPGRKDR